MDAIRWGQGEFGLSLIDRDQLERKGWMTNRAGSRHVGSAHRLPSRLAARLFAAIALSAFLLPTFYSVASAEEFNGYVKPTALNVRAEPGAKSSIAGILLKYDPVVVTGERRVGKTRWYNIKASGDYVTGWVAARFIARGEAPASTQEANIDYGAHETPTLLRGNFKYVGVRVCADCHSDSTGDFEEGAVPVWESHFHSQAHKTLQRDYTKKIAQKTREVDDPATDWRCVKCHQAAFGAGPEQTASSYRAEDGVSCEVCHGPGSVYADEEHGPDVPNREAMGFRVLRNLSDRREVCTSCHNQASPTFIGFDLREFSRKIAHWVDKDDAAYYAEYDQEAGRRANAMAKAEAEAEAEAEKSSKSGGGLTAAAGAAAASAAQAAEQAAAEAARADAAAAKAASEAAAIAAAKKADQANADSAAAREMAAENAKTQEAARRKAAAEAKVSADAAAAQAALKAQQAKADAAGAAAAAKKVADERANKAAADAAAKAAQAAQQAKMAAAQSAPADNPLAKYLDDVDDTIRMNTDGKKYKSFKFPHRKHATGLLYSDIACQTCHHTQEDDDSPQSCNECHDIGGDADEEKAKKFYVHAKGLEFEGARGQEQISCASCHKAMNRLLAAGEREGEKAPVKCTQCHARNKK